MAAPLLSPQRSFPALKISSPQSSNQVCCPIRSTIYRNPLMNPHVYTHCRHTLHTSLLEPKTEVFAGILNIFIHIMSPHFQLSSHAELPLISHALDRSNSSFMLPPFHNSQRLLNLSSEEIFVSCHAFNACSYSKSGPPCYKFRHSTDFFQLDTIADVQIQ